MKTAYLGNEYDVELQQRLSAVLRQMGVKFSKHEWGVAGSQEVETWQVEIAGSIVTVEAETYTGLSVSGPAEIVDAICRRVAAQL